MANDLVERLRSHVQSRGGPAKDEDGNYIGKAWPMMLEAAVRIVELEEALKPFAQAFEIARLNYSKRYQDRELGLKNLDKMPDDWPMERLLFNMGTFRAAARAYKGA